MIAIIDYGMGNIHSVRKALEVKGAKVVVTNSSAQIKKSDKLVLPGVGAFGDAMRELDKLNLSEAIIEHIKDKKVLLGICLGMHLLFESSEESPGARGLGVLKGKVEKFQGGGIKIPHMGWNQIKIRKADCPLFVNLGDGGNAYFCHSYYPKADDSRIIAASTEYGVDFLSIIWQDNIYATQFHPEKSQAVGLKLLENFVNL